MAVWKLSEAAFKLLFAFTKLIITQTHLAFLQWLIKIHYEIVWKKLSQKKLVERSFLLLIMAYEAVMTIMPSSFVTNYNLF